MNDLERFAAAHGGRCFSKQAHYFEVYDRHFARFRGTDVHVVEIGVGDGGSLQMWKHYFGAGARIFGVDINPHCKEVEETQITVLIGDQGDRQFLNTLAARIPRIDILIDDGGHMMIDQIRTFEALFPHIADNGVYLCEDLETSYRSWWGGGYRRRGTFVERSKSFIDAIHAWHVEGRSRLRVTDFTRSVHGLHYYDSALVIEKRPRPLPPDVVSGGTLKIPGYAPPVNLQRRIRAWWRRHRPL